MTKNNKNTKNNEAGNKPDYSNNGIAVWINNGKKGKYLAIQIIGHNTIYAFENKEE